MNELKAFQSADSDWEQQEMCLKQFVVNGKEPFAGKTIRQSGIREDYGCLIVGIEKTDGTLRAPTADSQLLEGEVIWVVGEARDMARLFDGQIQRDT